MPSYLSASSDYLGQYVERIVQERTQYDHQPTQNSFLGASGPLAPDAGQTRVMVNLGAAGIRHRGVIDQRVIGRSLTLLSKDNAASRSLVTASTRDPPICVVIAVWRSLDVASEGLIWRDADSCKHGDVG
jgi:hypothetical protein